jgi:hypothetical protein
VQAIMQEKSLATRVEAENASLHQKEQEERAKAAQDRVKNMQEKWRHADAMTKVRPMPSCDLYGHLNDKVKRVSASAWGVLELFSVLC